MACQIVSGVQESCQTDGKDREPKGCLRKHGSERKFQNLNRHWRKGIAEKTPRKGYWNRGVYLIIG